MNVDKDQRKSSTQTIIICAIQVIAVAFTVASGFGFKYAWLCSSVLVGALIVALSISSKSKHRIAFSVFCAALIIALAILNSFNVL